MSIQTDILSAIDSIKLSLPDAVQNVVYKGDSFTGITYSLSIAGQPVSFNESESAMSTIVIKTTDIKTKPIWGALINIDGKDRLIKDAKIDAVGASWTIEHVEYYSEWAIITGYVTVDGEAVEVYQQIKCRILDSEQETFDAYPDDYTQMDMTTVCIRVSDWQYAAIPQEGLKIEITGRTNLNVKKVNTVSGDYKLSCREGD